VTVASFKGRRGDERARSLPEKRLSVEDRSWKCWLLDGRRLLLVPRRDDEPALWKGEMARLATNRSAADSTAERSGRLRSLLSPSRVLEPDGREAATAATPCSRGQSYSSSSTTEASAVESKQARGRMMRNPVSVLRRSC
jgi:hypothetical protein